MANVLLISTDYVKQATVIDDNVDDKYLKFAILEAQTIQLQELIGTDLLEEIKDQIAAASITAANQTLLDSFIVPYITAQVIASSVIPMQYKFRNKAIVTMSSEEANAVSAADVSLVLRQYQSQAQFRGERMRKYLLENGTTYPLYLSGNTECWKIRPARTAYNTGLFLGNQRKPQNPYRDISSMQRDSWIYYNGPCSCG